MTTSYAAAFVSDVPVIHTNAWDKGEFLHIYQMERAMVETTAIALGRFDTKGRELGHRVRIDREVWVYGSDKATSLCPLAEVALYIGETFVVRPQPMRDGAAFGASQRGKRVRTMAEAEALREAMFQQARNTVGKKSGVK